MDHFIHLVVVKIVLMFEKAGNTKWKRGRELAILKTYKANRASCLPAPCWTRYCTISKWPSKQAARSGVEFVFVVELTLAPRSVSSLTISRCPAAAAHHSGGAPSIVSPSNVTEPEEADVNSQLQARLDAMICIQCDQMARVFLLYLAIYNNEVLPISIKKLPK